MAFTLEKGINISHWLSQSEARGEIRKNWFKEEDVRRISRWGMDHIRIPIDEVQMWTPDGLREEEAFELLNNALDWCEAEGIKAIVDLHILRSHFFNDSKEPIIYTVESEKQKFAKLWNDLSDFMKNRDKDLIAYEMLNEAVARDNEKWNQLYPYPYNVIREKEPERTILLGSNGYNHWSTYPDLKIPEDNNLILTFHYYNPMFITHYQTNWTPMGLHKGPISYPGVPLDKGDFLELIKGGNRMAEAENSYFDIEVMRKQISVPANIAAAKGYPLYCGEFGCYYKCPAEIQKQWYLDIRTVFEEMGISWGAWDYKGSFGFVSSYDNSETGLRGYMLD